MMHLFASVAAASLVSAVWQGSLLALAVLIALKLLPNLSAAARSLVWLTVFGVVVLLHFAPRETTGAVLHVAPMWSVALFSVWLGASFVRAAQLVHGAGSLLRLSRRATPVAAPETVARHLRELGRPVELCTSDEVDRPSVCGFFRARVLFPPELMESLSATELEQVVLHELEHLRRRDDWTNLLQKASLVVFPLNPVLLWVERRLCQERELACDDGVLRSTGARKAYATCLAHLAEHTLVRRGISLALRAFERPSELTRRVTRILLRPTATLSPRASGTAIVVLVAAVTGGAVELGRMPQVVSFAPVERFEARTAAPEVEPSPMTGRVMLTRAAMPVPATARPRLRRVHRTQPQLVPQPWVFLTEWQGAPAAPRVRRAEMIQASFRPRQVQVQQMTYAAVPTMDGWLIIQL